MGSRRSASLTDVFGSTKSIRGLRDRMAEAMREHDGAGVVSAGAKIMSESTKFAQYTYYCSLLDPFVAGLVARRRTYTLQEVDKLARAEWSKIKDRADLRPSKYITEAIIDSVKKAYKGEAS